MWLALVLHLLLQPNWFNHNPLNTSFIILDFSPTIVLEQGEDHTSNWKQTLLHFAISAAVEDSVSTQITKRSL